MAESNPDNNSADLSFGDLTNFSNSPTCGNNLSNGDETEEIKRNIDIQENHELICLKHEDNKVILTEGKLFLSQLKCGKETSPIMPKKAEATRTTFGLNDNIFVISFLGDTASGKSFLANHLLGVQSFVFGENAHHGSTTANVTCFESASILSAEKNNCLVLDFEGENGSWFPRFMKRIVGHVFSPERAKQRRQAVGRYFPTLAYLVSNVIILLSQDDLFANSRYIDRAMTFAAQAVGDVQQNMHKPVLILVQNKNAGNHVLSPAQATSEFKQTHPHVKELEMFFSHVLCVIIPYKHTETTSNINTNFDTQVDALRQLLIAINHTHQARLLPHLPWLLLNQHVMRKVSAGETINVQIALKDAFMRKHDKKEDDIILDLFHKLYQRKSVCSTHWFHYCRRFAIDVLARYTALRSPKFEGETFETMIHEECQKRLKDLWTMLEEYRPCEALYMGKGHVKVKDRPVFCYQSKGSHKEMKQHQTSEPVYGASWFRALLELFGLKTIDKWEGSFETSDSSSDSPGEDMHKCLLKQTKDYIKQLKNSSLDTYLTFYQLLKRWNIDLKLEDPFHRGLCYCCAESDTMNDHTYSVSSLIICPKCDEDSHKVNRDQAFVQEEPELAIDKEDCVICMSSKREVMFRTCNHYHFCQPCAKKILDKFKMCPLCKMGKVTIEKVN